MVGFHNFSLRTFNLSLKSEQIDCGCFFTRCRISMCQGLDPKQHDEISEIDGIWVQRGTRPQGSATAHFRQCDVATNVVWYSFNMLYVYTRVMYIHIYIYTLLHLSLSLSISLSIHIYIYTYDKQHLDLVSLRREVAFGRMSGFQIQQPHTM